MFTTGSVHFGQLRFWAWVRLCPEFWLACTLRYLLWMFLSSPSSLSSSPSSSCVGKHMNLSCVWGGGRVIQKPAPSPHETSASRQGDLRDTMVQLFTYEAWTNKACSINRKLQPRHCDLTRTMVRKGNYHPNIVLFQVINIYIYIYIWWISFCP